MHTDTQGHSHTGTFSHRYIYTPHRHTHHMHTRMQTHVHTELLADPDGLCYAAERKPSHYICA